jgi:hypothetical protein
MSWNSIAFACLFFGSYILYFHHGKSSFDWFFHVLKNLMNGCMTVSCTVFDQFMKTHFSFSIFYRTHVFESVHALSKINSHFQEESSFWLFVLTHFFFFASFKKKKKKHTLSLALISNTTREVLQWRVHVSMHFDFEDRRANH